MRTVAGVLPNVAEAWYVAHKIESLGIARNEINVVPGAMDKSEARKVERSRRSDAAAARDGAFRGAGVGLLLGVLVLALPGVRPFVFGSAILTLCATALVGAILVSIMVMMENMGESHEEAALHDEAVREGGVVVAAHVSEETEPEVVTTLWNNGARHVQAVADVSRFGLASEYRYEHPYPCDSAVKAR
jgi:hypothetical protein